MSVVNYRLEMTPEQQLQQQAVPGATNHLATVGPAATLDPTTGPGGGPGIGGEGPAVAGSR